jgi:hypothetical protein
MLRRYNLQPTESRLTPHPQRPSAVTKASNTEIFSRTREHMPPLVAERQHGVREEQGWSPSNGAPRHDMEVEGAHPGHPDIAPPCGGAGREAAPFY